MVLSDGDILDRVKRLQQLLVSPFDPMCLKPASYDLSLGNEFMRFPEDSPKKVIDLSNPVEDGERVWIKNDEELIIEPGEFVLAVTRERVAIPDDLVARVEGKSTTGRSGLMVHVTAGYIDPGFNGFITLELCALRRSNLALRPGTKVAQLSFLQMTSPACNPYNGRYQSATGVEGPKPERFHLTEEARDRSEVEPLPLGGLKRSEVSLTIEGREFGRWDRR